MYWIKTILKLQSFWFILFWISFFIWGKIDNDPLMMKLSMLWLIIMIIVFIRDLYKKRPH